MSIESLGATLKEVCQVEESPRPKILNSDTLNATPPSTVKKKTICGVCTTRESRYKCSKCYLLFCSLDCSKIHNKNHPTPSKNTQTKTSFPVHDFSDNIKQQTKSKQPFAPLDESKDLQRLFMLYPNLPNVLERIHEATLPPSVNSSSNPYLAMGRSNRENRESSWTSDIGLQKGIKALHAAQGTGDLDSEGVRAYGQLVLNIVHGNPEENAAEKIRRELLEHDNKIIEGLLHGRL
ncbi:putative zinc finger family protein [Erysiphe neolycopersici]|uniref:Putative zinc finger family protein n=1 Tax=Erysiphe neolycopersici TaxID=212602 RepID=A0A420HYU6_9PEZI|nr:putative zinc finger family protein [Erysiphe neolycopersici]